MSTKIQICKQLAKEIKNFLSIPAAFFDLDGSLIAYTDKKSLSELLQQQKKIHSDAFSCEFLNGLYVSLHDLRQNPYVYMLLLSNSNRYVSWIQTLLDICLTNQVHFDQPFTMSNDKLSFVYQILSYKPQNSEAIVSRATQLKYKLNLPRCTLVFMLPDYLEGADPSAGEELQKTLLQAIAETPGYNPDDLGDFLTNRQFVLFKTIPVSDVKKRRAFLTQYTSGILESSALLKSSCIRIGIGTVYSDLRKMCSSFQEAQFVLKNLDILEAKKQIGFAEDYTYDYLASLLPEEHQNKRFSGYVRALRRVSYLPETLKVLVSENFNLSASAKHLKIHRNTMLQRYQKLTEVTGLDPMHILGHNTTARQCAVYLNRKTVFHAGIVIQSSSDLHRGCRHFSSLIQEKSGNTIEVEVLNVGLSGNNKSLLDLLLCGALDFAVLDIDTLIPYAGNELSVCNLPHIFNSDEDAYRLLTGTVGKHLLSPLEKNRLIGLSFWTMGWRYFSCYGQPLRVPSQLKGKRVRVMHKELFKKYINFLGAKPIAISYDNILAALKEHIVDYQENPYVNFRDMQFYKQHNWILQENSFFSTNALITSASLWKKLSDEQKQIITEAAQESTLWQWQSAKQHNINCQQQLRENNGIHIYQPTSEEQAQWLETAHLFKQTFPHQDLLNMIADARKEDPYGSHLPALF